jgi:hypothetical protein
MSTTDTATPEATARSEFAAKRDRELLERRKRRAWLGPVLIPLPAASAKPAVYGSSFNALRQHTGAARAREPPK